MNLYHFKRNLKILFQLQISYYGSYPAGASACSLDPMPPILSQSKWTLAAVSKEDFLGSLICGTCLRISVIDLTRNDDPEDIFATIVDSCNGCEKGGLSYLCTPSACLPEHEL